MKDGKFAIARAWKLVTNSEWPFEPEYRFDQTRRWRFDWARRSEKLAIEIDGASYKGKGRHQTPDGMAADNEKINAATLQWWRILRFTTHQVRQDPAGCVETILQALTNTKPE